MSDEQSVTLLPSAPPAESEPQHSNPARAVQEFVSAPLAIADAAMNQLNTGFGRLTQGIAQALPSFPAARLFGDLVFGWPHYHMHPPNLVPPAPPIFLPSIGPVICAGAVNVLINGLPAARCGDVGFGAWCGGFYPLFEVFTGSSHVFIGGARASRMLIDFTRHCLPPFLSGKKGVDAAKKGFKGMSKLEKAMSIGLPLGLGGLGVAASLTDMSNANQDAENAESASEAAAASAAASASALDAAMTAAQTAADLVAMALSVGMGKDPGLPPMLCLGNFITGSFNVLIGGFPMPAWTVFSTGLGKLFKKGVNRFRRPKPNPGNVGLVGCTTCPGR
jgi:hypothetical protein